MKILITGVSGYIGSNLAPYLKSKGYDVYGLIRQPLQDKDLIYKLDGIKLYTFDKTNLIAVISHIKPDLVVHLASLYLASHNYNQISDLVESNITFPTYLLEAMNINGVKKLVNTGTSWQHYNSSDYDPVNLYAASKQAFDDVVKYYTSAKGFTSITLKLFDTYGPNDKRNKLISLLDKLAESGEYLAMSGGEQVIELTHIDDVCSAYECAINQLESQSAGYNALFSVDSKKHLSLKQLVSLYEQVNHCKLNIGWGERSYREREVMFLCNNLIKLPNWTPKVTLQEGLKQGNRIK